MSSTSSRSPKPFETRLGVDDDVAEPRPGRDVDLDLVQPDVLVVGEQLLVLRQPRLRLRMPRLRARAHPLELARERTAARGLGLLLLRQSRLLLLEPGGVVALERDPLAAVELEDPAGDVVEEIAVVGDGDDGALVRLEEALEPGDRLGVEMVRRLVEQEQVGRGEQEARERDPAPLAARKRGHVAVAVRQAERIHRPVERRLEAPRVGTVDLLLHLCLLLEQRVEVGVGLRKLRRDLVEAVEQVALLADAVLDVLAHVPLGVELRLLGEHADGRSRRQLRDTARRLLEPGHDPQQRRLAGPVRTEHADLRAGEEAERDVRQDLPVGAVELVGPVHGEDVVEGHDADDSDRWTAPAARLRSQRVRAAARRALRGYRAPGCRISLRPWRRTQRRRHLHGRRRRQHAPRRRRPGVLRASGR